jgi:hypothetical protein
VPYFGKGRVLSLRLARLDEMVFYWANMQKNGAGDFEQVPVPMPAARLSSDLSKLLRKIP